MGERWWKGQCTLNKELPPYSPQHHRNSKNYREARNFHSFFPFQCLLEKEEEEVLEFLKKELFSGKGMED